MIIWDTTVILEQTHLREPGLKGCTAVSKLRTFVHFLFFSQLYACLPGYVCTNSFRALIAAWLGACRRIRVVHLGSSARQYRMKRFEQFRGLDIALRNNLPLLFKTHPTHCDIITTRCVSCGFGNIYITSCTKMATSVTYVLCFNNQNKVCWG